MKTRAVEQMPDLTLGEDYCSSVAILDEMIWWHTVVACSGERHAKSGQHCCVCDECNQRILKTSLSNKIPSQLVTSTTLVMLTLYYIYHTLPYALTVIQNLFTELDQWAAYNENLHSNSAPSIWPPPLEHMTIVSIIMGNLLKLS